MTPIEIPTSLYQKIQQEGVAAYPNECCGVLYGRDLGQGDASRRVVEKLEVVLNEFDAEEQYHRFLITPQTLMKAEKTASAEGRLVLGFYHSHPDHPARPSEYDRQHGWPFYSYVIVSIEKAKPALMTCWVLEEATDTFVPQEIVQK